MNFLLRFLGLDDEVKLPALGLAESLGAPGDDLAAVRADVLAQVAVGDAAVGPVAFFQGGDAAPHG